VSWHLLGHAIKSVICFDLQFSHSTRPMTSFCIFIKRWWFVMTITSTNRKGKNAWEIPSLKTYLTSIFTFPVCWRNRHHKSSPFLECRPSKLYFKILWKYDDWWFRFHHFLENGWFYRENTYKCSPLVTKWQIILHFHC
jgi:hypothetical protein